MIARIFSIVALAGASVASVAFSTLASQGCGGCYNDYAVVGLASDPTTTCLGLSSTEVDPCTGDYDVLITNGCTDTLTLGSVTITPGASGRVSGQGATTGTDGRRSYPGTLGSQTITLYWYHSETE